MTAITRKSAAFELHRGREASYRAPPVERCSLRATEDGWSLMAPSGEIIFRGLGLSSRRECLERARALGVLAVTS